MTDKADKLEQAKNDMGRVFSNPQDIASTNDLTPDEKIELLKQWELDLRLKMVASEEGMTGNDSARGDASLPLIHSLLAGLGYTECDPTAVNKTGG